MGEQRWADRPVTRGELIAAAIGYCVLGPALGTLLTLLWRAL